MFKFMLNPEGSLAGKRSQERKGWRVELRNEMKSCPGSRVVKSCYLVVFRLGQCKVTFTGKVSLQTGGTKTVAGGAPCSTRLYQDWDAPPAAGHLQHRRWSTNLGKQGFGVVSHVICIIWQNSLCCPRPRHPPTRGPA